MPRSDQKRSNPDIGILTGRLLFAIQDELFERLAEEGHEALRPRHGAVLAYLDAEGSRATDLAELSGRHKQNIGVVIDELEALGYVTRAPDPSDRRAKLVVPTALGRDEMTQSDAIVREIEDRHAQNMAPGEYATFRELLIRVERAQRGRKRDPGTAG
jgi:DNA-binding MarR family transcriptional regulator